MVNVFFVLAFFLYLALPVAGFELIYKWSVVDMQFKDALWEGCKTFIVIFIFGLLGLFGLVISRK